MLRTLSCQTITRSKASSCKAMQKKLTSESTSNKKSVVAQKDLHMYIPKGAEGTNIHMRVECVELICSE